MISHYKYGMEYPVKYEFLIKQGIEFLIKYI